VIRKRKGCKTRGECRDCKKSQPVGQTAWLKAALPRCIACGGALDRKGMWRIGSTSVTQALCPGDIPFPGESTEFEIQAMLFAELREMGLIVRGCVGASGGADVFDLVVYDESRRAVRIIEVKKDNVRAEKSQLARYSKYGVPVDEVSGRRQALDYLQCVREGRSGIPLPGPVAAPAAEPFAFVG
jgi:hypothetical protein